MELERSPEKRPNQPMPVTEWFEYVFGRRVVEKIGKWWFIQQVEGGDYKEQSEEEPLLEGLYNFNTASENEIEVEGNTGKGKIKPPKGAYIRLIVVEDIDEVVQRTKDSGGRVMNELIERISGDQEEKFYTEVGGFWASYIEDPYGNWANVIQTI